MSVEQNQHEQHQSSPPPRRKRRWILALIAAMIVLPAAGVVYVIFDPSQLKQELAALQEEGLPTNAVELNAYYGVPSGVADTTKLWTAATAAVRDAKISERARGLPIVGMAPTPIPAPGTEWPELEASRSFLKELEPEMQIIRRAAEAGGMARYPVDFSAGIATLLPDAQEARTLARPLELSAHVSVHNGRPSDVLQDVIAVFRLSDSLRGEPILVSQLVRIAIHAIGCHLANDMLQHCKWTDDDLERLQDAIGQAEFRAEMIRAIRGEHANFFTTIDHYPGVWFRDANKLKSIELFSESADALSSSWQDARKKGEEIGLQLNTKPMSAITQLKQNYIQHLFPAMEQAVNAGARAEVRQNCLIAKITAYRYRLRHGTWPMSLADLRDFMAGDEATRTQRLTDPFDGHPLRLKSENGIILIYSISENRIDDGGVISNEKPQEGDYGYLIQIDFQQPNQPQSASLHRAQGRLAILSALPMFDSRRYGADK